MISHLQQKCALALVLACFVASSATLAYANQAGSDGPLFFCPAGQEDAMQYFVMRKDLRENHYLSGEANPSYTKIFPDEDFAPSTPAAADLPRLSGGSPSSPSFRSSRTCPTGKRLMPSAPASIGITPSAWN